MTQDILPSSMEIGRWHRILHVCEASTSKPPQCPSPTWCPFSWVRRLLVSTILLIFSLKIFGSFISKMDSYHGFVSFLCSVSFSLALLAQSCSFVMHPLYHLSEASLWLFCLMLNNPRLPLLSDRMTKYKPLAKPRVTGDLPPSPLQAISHLSPGYTQCSTLIELCLFFLNSRSFNIQILPRNPPFLLCPSTSLPENNFKCST